MTGDIYPLPTQLTPQGWQCPVCGKVMSPFTSECVNDHERIETDDEDELVKQPNPGSSAIYKD